MLNPGTKVMNINAATIAAKNGSSFFITSSTCSLATLQPTKEYISHRRRDGADGQVHDNHDAKLDGVHSQALYNGKENRRKYEQGRGHVHKGSHNQQQNVDDEKESHSGWC